MRTVRKYVSRIERGASEPRRALVPKKLDRFSELIEAKVAPPTTRLPPERITPVPHPENRKA